LLIAFILACSGITALWLMVSIPDPNADFTTNTTQVYYRDGKRQLGTFQVQNRYTVSYEQIPENVRNAIVAAENRTFWTDPGFSIPALARAGIGILTGHEVTGASTITQQYVKVLYLTQERTLSRKVKELILAAKIGQSYSKEQILTNYLNTVYYGRGAYGIEAASQAYFKKSATKLELA
jgi:membrane peptidoglycan carboxypeptidase